MQLRGRRRGKEQASRGNASEPELRLDGDVIIDLTQSARPGDVGDVDGSILEGMADFGAPVADSAFKSDDAQRYSAWADRMRDKRTRDQATILGTADENPSAGYWSTESVLDNDDPVDEPGIVPDDLRTTRLLQELGLEPGATTDDVTRAYRQLAKKHHPDRWVSADEETRTGHAEAMLRINAVYRVLRVDRSA